MQMQEHNDGTCNTVATPIRIAVRFRHMAIEGASNGVSMTRDEFHDKDRAAFLAGDMSEDEKPADVEAVAEVEEETDEAEAVEAKTDDEDRAEEESPEEVEDEPEVEEKPDAETSKRLAQVQKTEARARAQLKADRDALEQERTQWKAQVDKVAEFEALAKRAKYDPAAVLRALGMNEDDFELAAHALYGESKSASADPKQKAAALARLKEREKDDKYTALEKKQAELEAKIERQQSEARAQAELAQYVSKVHDAVAQDPIVAHCLKVDAEDTNEQLAATYTRLEKTLNRKPKPSEVVKSYGDRLRKLGISPALAKAKPAANGNAVAKKPGETPAAANTNEKPPTRDEMLRELEELERSNRLS